MTQTSGESKYPTEWHSIDETNYILCRQTSDDTYQLKDSHNGITLNTEGFNLWRSNLAAFIKWRDETGVEPERLGPAYD